jgi:hypothetical protein
MELKTATLGGQKWKLKDSSKIPHDDCVGLCDYETNTLYIPLNPTGVEDLDTIIHEVLHALLEDLSEEAVEEYSRDIARLLSRLGYRKP